MAKKQTSTKKKYFISFEVTDFGGDYLPKYLKEDVLNAIPEAKKITVERLDG